MAPSIANVKCFNAVMGRSVGCNTHQDVGAGLGAQGVKVGGFRDRPDTVGKAKDEVVKVLIKGKPRASPSYREKGRKVEIIFTALVGKSFVSDENAA